MSSIRWEAQAATKNFTANVQFARAFQLLARRDGFPAMTLEGYDLQS
jgi:hypothetical protein